MGVGDVNMKCAGDVAKGVRGWPGMWLRGTRIRTQASAEIGCARVASECIGGIAGAALCDMEITLCNCTYVQFFL